MSDPKERERKRAREGVCVWERDETTVRRYDKKRKRSMANKGNYLL